MDGRPADNMKNQDASLPSIEYKHRINLISYWVFRTAGLSKGHWRYEMHHGTACLDLKT